MSEASQAKRQESGAVFLPREPVYESRYDGPLFGDTVWDFTNIVSRKSQGDRRIDLRTIPSGYREDAACILMVLAQPVHESVVAEGVVRKAHASPVSTLIGRFGALRTLSVWGALRGLDAFADWKPNDADQLLIDLRSGSHRKGGPVLLPGTVRHYIETVKLLRELAPVLPGGGLRFRPWVGHSAARVAGDARKLRQNDAEPLPWETWEPLIRAAWCLVDRFSPDILDALAVAKSLPVEPRGPSGRNAFRILLDWHHSEGLLPLHTGVGRYRGERGTPNPTLLCRLLGINDSVLNPANHAFRSEAVALLDDAVSAGRTAYGGIFVPTIMVKDESGSESTWIDEIGLGECNYLESVLRAACYVILSSLTGMRDSELQELTRGSATTRDGLPALDSLEYKGEPDPLGKERSWWAPVPVMRAVEVLSSLSSNGLHLLARSEENLSPYDPSRDIPRLVSFVNDRAAGRPGRGQGLALPRIDITTDLPINATTLRRSFCVFASTSPNAEAGLGIQLGHVAVRTTTGYMTDGQQLAVGLMNDARTTVTRGMAAELIRGESPVAGTPARDILAFRAQVIADPLRAEAIEVALGEKLHPGTTNDCRYEEELAACGPGGPKLGDHLCMGSGCGNALFTLAHKAMLQQSIQRADRYLESERGKKGNESFSKQLKRDRASAVSMLRELEAGDTSLSRTSDETNQDDRLTG
jgi:hypothetical protein